MESQRGQKRTRRLLQHVVALDTAETRQWQDGGGTASGLATVVGVTQKGQSSSVGAGGAWRLREETSCGAAGFRWCSTGGTRCRKTSGNWGEPGRRAWGYGGIMVGVEMRWESKYIPTHGWNMDLFKMCCPFADFPAGYVRGHWITHWGRIKQYNSMARLVDFAFFGLVISWPTCTVYSLPFWCTKC